MYEDSYIDAYWEDRFWWPLVDDDYYGPEDDDRYDWNDDYEDDEDGPEINLGLTEADRAFYKAFYGE